MRKQIVVILFMSLLLLTLTGCTKIDETFNAKIESQIIESNPSYAEAVANKEKYDIDSNGTYQPKNEETSTDNSNGTIKVLFGRISNIDIDYYLDMEETQFVSISNCYVNPGDEIYYAVKERADNPLYSFRLFNIYSIDDKNSDIKLIDVVEKGEKLIVPENYQNANVYIEPFGAYEKGHLYLNDYSIENNKEKELFCNWIVGNVVTDSKEFEISSYKETSICCDYSSIAKSYYYAGPKDVIFRDEDGILEFNKFTLTSSSQTIDAFFKQYINITLKEGNALVSFISNIFNGDKITEIRVDGKVLENEEQIQNAFSKVKPGQTIIVTVKNKYAVSLNPIPSQTVAVGDTTQYVFKIPDTTNITNLVMNIRSASDMNSGTYTQKIIENGVITLSPVNSGASFNEGDSIDNDAKVVLRIQANEGYYVLDKKNDFYEETLTYSKYLSEIDNIISKHPIKKIFLINFVTEDKNGIVTFERGKEKLSGICEIKEGDKITIKYTITNDALKFKGDKKNLLGKYKIEESVNKTYPDGFNGTEVSAMDFFTLEDK